MGNKIRPDSYRLGIIKPWQSRWFLKGQYKNFLEQDEIIRRVIMDKISNAGVVSIDIERTSGKSRVNIKAAKPGLIIGRGGKGIEELLKAIQRALLKKAKVKSDISLNIEELKRSEVSATYLAYQIKWDLERRMPFRRTVKRYLDQVMQNKEIKGGKIRVGGRLDGAEIARDESFFKGSLPLQTLRADIDYGEATARTGYGTIGIKVWLYKGDVFGNKQDEKNLRMRRDDRASAPPARPKTRHR